APATVAAVLLAAIVGRADVETLGAPGAAQVVEGKRRVHPRRRADGNWTGASGSARLRAYGPSAACTCAGPGGRPGPHIPSTFSWVLRPPWWRGEFHEGWVGDVSATTWVSTTRLVSEPWTISCPMTDTGSVGANHPCPRSGPSPMSPAAH